MFLALFGLLASAVEAQTTTPVNCATPGALQAAINAAVPGDILLVSGTCNENVTIFEGLTLDGQTTAAIHGPSTADATVHVTKAFVRVLNFASISGGEEAILAADGGAVREKGGIDFPIGYLLARQHLREQRRERP